MHRTGSPRLAVVRAVVALCTAACTLAFAPAAVANAPNPIPGTTKLDGFILNSDGSRTITVEGQWNWTSQTDCPTHRNGVGYQVAWFDGAPANPIGKSSSPNGVIGVGDLQDDIVHSVEVLAGMTTNGNAFWDGVPASYLSHNSYANLPNSTDAKNWVSDCNNEDPVTKVSSGKWGPISHTYPSTFTGPIALCPVLYDPHGSGNQEGSSIGTSSVGDITAGSSGHNADNSYEGNGNASACGKFTVPTLTTRASSSTAVGPVHDLAMLSGTGGASGTITWNVYADSNCTNSLDMVSVATSGDGSYTSPDYTPSSAGTYQWVATYSSSSGTVSTPCYDASEQSPVSTGPGIALVKLERDGSSGPFVAGPINGSVGDTIEYQMTVTNTGDAPLVIQFSDPNCDAGTLSAPTVLYGSWDASANTLSPTSAIRYTCSHVLTSGDPAAFTNTASAVGYPAHTPPVSATSSVVVKKVAVQSIRVKRCPAGTVKRTRKVHGKKVVTCVRPVIPPPISRRPTKAVGFTG